MLSVSLALEICGLKVGVSFNFALSAPHVKRRVKSCEPSAAAATQGSLGYVNALGVTRLVHWLIMMAPSCLRSHNARYIMLKSDYNMNYLVLIHYEAEIHKRSSEAGAGESCIVENLCMVLLVTCIATPLWRHNDSGVTKSTQNIIANMFKWEIIWIVPFVKCVSIDCNGIYVNSNKNSGTIL